MYNNMMFPKNGGRQWTMAEIDALDVHFFMDVLGYEEEEKEEYLSDLW